jgi:exopolyphosphatase/pppGpp-phosphohydrolase
MRATVLDIGSNSLQLLVADLSPERWVERAAAECVTRLGDGVSTCRSLGGADSGLAATRVEFSSWLG